jgi:hypothetical protein
MTRSVLVIFALVTALLGLPSSVQAQKLEHPLKAVGTAHPPLDLVYTFVNLTDARWASKYKTTTGADYVCHPLNSEILMSLLSVQKFFRWVNKVHIIQDNQVRLEVARV